VRPATSRLDSLTGLRALAALVVFGRHITPTIQQHDSFEWLQAVTRQGSSGVSLFFILSGFVLAWSGTGTSAKRQFWRRRVARIVPAYLVALALALAVTAVLPAVLGWRDLVSATLLQSWVPDHNWYYGGNSVGWSLSTEAFFYLMFPLIIGGIRRLSRRGLWILLTVAVALAILVPSLLRPSFEATEHFDGVEYWLVYVCPPVRFLEFVAGVAAACLLRAGVRVRVPLGPAAVLAVGAYLVAGQTAAWASYVAVPVIPFLLLIVAAADRDIRGGRSLLRNRVLVAAGVGSYAFYLVHYSIYRVVDGYWLYRGQPDGQAAVVLVACFAAAGVLAWLLYAFVERPAETWLRRPRRAPESPAPSPPLMKVGP
jgi:peptidoglycan/LPS O-acetylase OafA/YrhL